jgi:hypothetical protein
VAPRSPRDVGGRLLAVEWKTSVALYEEGSSDATFEDLERRWEVLGRTPLARVRILRGRVLAHCKSLAFSRAIRAHERGANEAASRHARRAVDLARAYGKLGRSFEATGGGFLMEGVWASVTGDRSHANRLRAGVVESEARGMRASANATRVFLGRVLGDERLASEGRAWLLRQGVRRPDAFAGVVCGLILPRQRRDDGA